MRQNIQKYLAAAEHDANQRVMSATGDRNFGADGFIDQHYFTNDLNPGEFYPADSSGAAAQAAPAALSQPYVLQVSNTSASNVGNFNIWWANQYLGGANGVTGATWTNGSLTISGVTISAAMNNANITYFNMLQQSLTNNFTIGKTYISVLSGSNAQAIQPLSIYTQDSNGNTAGKFLPSPLSPFQFQAGVYENNFPYKIDGNTAVTMTVLASVVFQIYFYPSVTLNLARALGGGQVGRSFEAPMITPPQAVKAIN